MNNKIQAIVEKQKAFFSTGKSKNISFRIEQLKKLKSALMTYEKDILKALHEDLKKPEFSAYVSEIYFCLQEISIAIKNIKTWAHPQFVKNPWYLFSASSYIMYEPLGVSLIISPWNYPFQLSIVPLIGSIAAGNCAIIKPSEACPTSSRILHKIIQETFGQEYIAVIEGDAQLAQDLLEEKFDYIFFTGGTEIGKKVMQAAAKNLTPLTLELGGKNPCIITKDVSLELAAKRIIRAKFSNMGQSCIAPNYIFAHKSIKKQLVDLLKKYIKQFYNPKSGDLGKIINEKHFDRLMSLLTNCTIISGGTSNKVNLYLEPTLIEDIDENHPAMQEEIFGPILPILEYDSLDQVIKYINSQPKPLTLYLFSNDKKTQFKVLHQTSSGSVCINDVGTQFTNHNLPFGGVGDSGFGKYHAKKSFETFSHAKSIMKKSNWFDFSFKYPASSSAKNGFDQF